MHTTLLTHRALSNKPFELNLTKQEGFYSLRQAQPRQSGIGKRVLFLSSSILLGVILATLSLQGYAEEGEDISAVSVQKNITTYTVNIDGSYKEEHEVAILIETQDAVSTYGEKRISYTPKLESIQLLAAYTISPNGTHIQVPKKSIHTAIGELGRGGYVFSDQNSKVIIYPKVTVGSQLYIKYIKTCHTPLFPGQFAFRHIMSPHLKSALTEININFDRRLNVQIDAKDVEGGVLPDKNGMRRYSYTHKQAIKLPFETGQIDSGDYSPYVQASTFASYEELGAAYEEKLKEKVNVTTEIQTLANKLTQGVDNPKDQTRILYNWVSKNIRYVASYIGNGGYVPHDSQTILSNRWGDCKDHAVILEALLAAKEIKSSAVLISAGSAFQLPKLAGVHAFNHVITYVPSLDLYLDSTAQFAPMGTLPSVDLNKNVVLTALNKIGKTPAMLASENTAVTHVFMKVLSDGTIQGTSKVIDTGTAEIDLRQVKSIAQSMTQEKMADILLDVFNLSGKGKVHSGDPNNLDKQLEVNATFTLDPVSNFPGPGSMPIPAGVVDEAITRNTMQKPKDKFYFPSLCTSATKSNHYEIEFPSNIKITHVPKNVKYSDPTVQYSATYALKGNKLEIDRELIIQNTSMVCGEAENELDKRFFPVFQRDMRAQVMYE